MCAVASSAVGRLGVRPWGTVRADETRSRHTSRPAAARRTFRAQTRDLKAWRTIGTPIARTACDYSRFLRASGVYQKSSPRRQPRCRPAPAHAPSRSLIVSRLLGSATAGEHAEESATLRDVRRLGFGLGERRRGGFGRDGGCLVGIVGGRDDVSSAPVSRTPACERPGP